MKFFGIMSLIKLAKVALRGRAWIEISDNQEGYHKSCCRPPREGVD